jgi:hypothetical protein
MKLSVLCEVPCCCLTLVSCVPESCASVVSQYCSTGAIRALRTGGSMAAHAIDVLAQGEIPARNRKSPGLRANTCHSAHWNMSALLLDTKKKKVGRRTHYLTGINGARDKTAHVPTLANQIIQEHTPGKHYDFSTPLQKKSMILINSI